jgi:hypothetical protein
MFNFKLKDNDLWRRLRFYGFGLLMGCLLVSVITKGKACQMPGTLKMEKLNSQALKLTPGASHWMNCMGISLEDMKQLLKQGDVNFGKSEVHSTPCPTYAIDSKTKAGQHIRLVVADCADTTKIICGFNLDSEHATCKCE